MGKEPSEREQPSQSTGPQRLADYHLDTTSTQPGQTLYSVPTLSEEQLFATFIASPPAEDVPFRLQSSPQPQPPTPTSPIFFSQNPNPISPNPVSRGVPLSNPSPNFLSFDLVPRVPTPMSRHSSTAAQKSPAKYELLSSNSPADQAKALSQNNKDQLIDSLRKHKVNTITELRRIEKIFAYLDSSEVTEPMTSAWAYYVNSNSLLNELRGLTRTIPFSSECVDEAKARVVSDPASVRSWNYCWLVLVKIEKENLVMKYARALASKKSTWGNKQPTADDARKFISACIAEWTRALEQMLRHWDEPPSTTGN